jgi:histidyl-tRNA synthetase
MPDDSPKPRKFAAPRGTADVTPDDWPWWRHVRDTAERVCERFGYRRIETPVIEHAGVYLRSVGEGTDIVEKEVYLFEDRGGDRLALRPEGTAGVVRAYIEHGMSSLPQPVRLFYTAPNFRYDRPQAGRYRQHTQFGVECIGDAGPLVDAEVIELLMTFYAELGLRDISLRINSIGDENCRPAYIEKLREYYRPRLADVCADCRVRFEKNPMRLLDCKEAPCQPIIAGAPRLADYLCDACREHFAALQGYLSALGLAFEVDDRLVRGLDYYTRTAFEVQPAVEASQSALGGGGRYDGLIELLGGAPTPGIGFGTGFERIILNLKRQEVPLELDRRLALFIAPLVDDAAIPALRIAAAVRAEGEQVIVGSLGRSLKALMRQAGQKNARYVAIIGENDLKAGTVTLRNMESHSERAIPFDNVPAEVRGAD